MFRQHWDIHSLNAFVAECWNNFFLQNAPIRRFFLQFFFMNKFFCTMFYQWLMLYTVCSTNNSSVWTLNAVQGVSIIILLFLCSNTKCLGTVICSLNKCFCTRFSINRCLEKCFNNECFLIVCSNNYYCCILYVPTTWYMHVQNEFL